jgi:hypothetical protein
MPAFAAPVVGDSPRCERGQFKAALIPPEEKPIQNRIKNATNVFECAIGDPPGKAGEIQ